MDVLQEISVFLRDYWGLWLMMLFIGLVLWALRPGNRKRFDEASQIPLRDENGNGNGKE